MFQFSGSIPTIGFQIQPGVAARSLQQLLEQEGPTWAAAGVGGEDLARWVTVLGTRRLGVSEPNSPGKEGWV